MLTRDNVSMLLRVVKCKGNQRKDSTNKKPTKSNVAQLKCSSKNRKYGVIPRNR